MNNYREKIIETKIKLELLKNQHDINKYLELSTSFNVLKYIKLIVEYNDSLRTRCKEELVECEKSNEVREYLDLIKKDFVQKYISLNEELAYLEYKLNESERVR